MQSIRVWSVTKEGGALVAAPCEDLEQAEAEQDLETLLVASPELLEEDLTLVGRQVQTPGGPLDLLGIDADGRPVVFELKRGTLARDAVAQVLDYVSYLAKLDTDGFAQLVENRASDDGIDPIADFRAWHQSEFGGDGTGYAGVPRAVLVGLGVDDRARRMAEFLAERGVEITLLTFHAFARDGQMFLARQVEIQRTEKTAATGRSYSKQENQGLLDSLAEQHGSKDLLEEVRAGLQNVLKSYVWPNASNYSLSLIERAPSGNASYRNYVSVYVDTKARGHILLVWNPRAVAVAKAEITGAVAHNGGATPVDGKSVTISLDRERWLQTKSQWLDCCAAIRRAYERRVDAEGTPA